MRPFDELRETTNRSVYNKVYKWAQENKGKLHCSHCKYHCGENSTNKLYGDISYYSAGRKKWYYFKARKPSWKLVSKNRKQWMKKPLIKTHKIRYGRNSYSLDW